MVYGIFLIKKGDRKGAESELQLAREGLEKLGGDPNLNYNLGLAYFDLGDYDKALEQAKTAYSLGFPLPGLRDKLKRANKWQE
jgi:tetratricopeptide (TPR) repeat protein